MKIETHPFPPFVPQNMNYLLLGSFTSKDSSTNPNYDWYYSNGRNQFWALIKSVYNIDLSDKDSKIQLFTKLQVGITDIIYRCKRTQNSSLDTVLKVVEYQPAISKLLESGIGTIFFSSRFVENLYKKQFSNLIAEYPRVKLVYLPSPSPRYAKLSKAQKVEIYKTLLPKL